MTGRRTGPGLLVALGAIAGGALLVVVPAFLFPACVHEGFPPTRCSATARAEMLAGAVLVAIGVAALLARGARPAVAAALLALALSAAALLLPERIGYCHNPRMPCTYGMVPAVRLVAVAVGALGIAGLAWTGRTGRRRRRA